MVWGIRGLYYSEARSFIGGEVDLRWVDAEGVRREARTEVRSVDVVPGQGPCLITAAGDVPLVRVLECQPATGVRAA